MEASAEEKSWIEKKAQSMLKQLRVEKGQTIIDFGCGKGRYTLPLAQAVGLNGRIFAVDNQKKELDILKTRLAEYSLEKTVSIMEAWPKNLIEKFTFKSVDHIFIFDVLQYIDDTAALFKSFSTVLKDKGILQIYPAENPHPKAVNMKKIKTDLEKYGFSLLKEKNFHMLHNNFMVEDRVYSFTLSQDPM